MILGLDPSSVATGWAVGPPGSVPVFGTYKPPRAADTADYGPFLDGTRTFLSEMITRHRVTHVHFEQPFMPRPGIKWVRNKKTGRMTPVAVIESNIHTLRKLYAVTGVIELICGDHNVDCSETNIGKWRSWFFTRDQDGKKPRGKPALKAAAIAQCRVCGWDVQNDNEADACGIWAHACWCIAKTTPTALAGELFEGAA